MLEYIRSHPRVVQALLILFVLPPFLLGGIEGLRWAGGAGNDVAKVNDQGISQQEWENAQREQMENFRQRMGARFDPKMFESAEVKQRMLDGLVEERVLQTEAKRRLLAVSDESLQEAITSIPGLQGEDGKFSKDLYVSRLAQIGMTPQIHQARMREDMIRNQLNGALQGSAIVPRSVASRLSDINDQEREVQEVLFKSADFAAKVSLTEQMIKDYYNKNAKLFETPESVKIEYVILNNEAVAAQLVIKDEDAKAFYDKNSERFKEKEQRKASHILVKTSKDMPAADKAKAKEKAEKLLAQVKANPADFAKLAKENSDDPGSGSQGGDLGFFEAGNMVKSFDSAVFGMKKGDISNLVESEFGYHIIQLVDVKPEKVKAFDEVKNDVMADMRRDQLSKKFSEMAEIFTNTVDEQSDLKPVAEHAKLKLKIETANDVSRTAASGAGPESPLNNPKFLKALFASQDALKGKRNTDVVDLGQNTLIAAHIKEHRPAKVRPLEEVMVSIRAALTQSESMNLAKKEGAAKLKALQAKDDVAGFSEVKTISRSKQPTVHPAAVSEIMRADTSKLPAYVGVELPGQGYAVYRVGKVSLPANLDQARRKTEAEQITNMVAQQDALSAMEWMKLQNKVKILKPQTATPSASASASASAAK